MDTTLLLDSDIVAYKFASANEDAFDWDGDGNKHRVTEDIDVVMDQTIDYVDKLVSDLKADRLIVCLSCPTPENFRVSVLPSYKGNRDPSKKPLLLSAVKERLAQHYEFYERPTLEADDIMGILSTHPSLIKGKKVIVSEDKDMQTIPGFLFNPRKDKKPRLISEEFADYYHLYQTLIGDTTDNYKGCPGVGPVKAEEALTCVSGYKAWRVVVELFEAAKDKKTKESLGLTEADALVQARVARILRASDYNFKKKEVILWTPKGTRNG